MKKIFLFVMCVSILLVGCGSEKNSETTQKSGILLEETTKAEETTDSESVSASEETSQAEEPKRMVMLEGKLYVDTGELGVSPTCGVMDFTFDKTTDGIPTKDGQTNFGKGYEGQYYEKNQIIIIIDGNPCLFKYQKN